MREARLVLASGSAIRRQLLANAGIRFEAIAADIDESPLPEEGPEPRARRLARQKALVLSDRRPDDWILGCDQTGITDAGDELSKCHERARAHVQLMAMAGRAHHFTSAAALARDGKVVWEGESSVRVRFRAFGEAIAEAYLDCDEWQGSAGSYQLENRGIHLVEHIEGSNFAVLGLPLLEVIQALRTHAPGVLGTLGA